MANKIAKFEKVSKERFVEDYMPSGKADIVTAEECWKQISMPERKTAGSAGYDFSSPLPVFTLQPGESKVIPTGIRAKIQEDWVLMLFPRSGLGFRYRVQLANTVGIIDSDYYGSDNEGHIMIKITNDSKEGKPVTILPGSGFAQGIFLPYGITKDDCASGVRNGGFGSTGK